MQLHVIVGSPNSRKALAVVNHLRLDIAIEYHDFFTGDLRKASFLAVNPNAMVPALVDGGFRLWESNAIMQYLADRAGGDALFPRNPQRRADIVRWQCWELAHFNKAFGTIGFEAIIKPTFNLGVTDQVLVANAMENLKRFAAVLERHLAGRQFVVGDDTTIADYSMIHLEAFKEAIAFDWSPYPNLNAYFDRMRKVEHWTRTAPPDMAAMGRKPQAA